MSAISAPQASPASSASPAPSSTRRNAASPATIKAAAPPTTTPAPRRAIAPVVEGAFVSAIRRTWDVLFQPDAVVELRVLKTTYGTAVGYFNDPGKLARAAERYNGQKSIYVTLNQLPAALLARSTNRLDYGGKATADKDVARRRWILIDFDPERPADISSTDAEHDAALARARDVHTWLITEGCPAESLVLCDSGNGAHVLVRIDLPNDEPTKVVVQRFLGATALRFGDERIKVDRTTANASRITKLYGTTAVKGSNTPPRPHRPATILDAPATVAPVPAAFLEKIAAYAPDPERWGAEVSTGKRHDIPALLEKLRTVVGIDLGDVRDKEWNGGRLWEAQVCPWDASHNNRAFCVIQFANGAVAAKCHHDGCAGKSWHEFRALFPPDTFPALNTASAIITNHVAGGFALTDLGNSERLIARYGADIRYAIDQQKWLVWDSVAWREDAGKAVVMDRAKQTARAIRDDADTEPDYEKRRRLASHWVRSELAARIDAMVTLAQSDPRVTITSDALDRDPWLFNCLDGTLDLRTGALRPHDRADLITRTAPVHYDPNAKFELWDRFLTETTDGDGELARFLQQAVGYTLTGDTGQEVLFFCYGAGATGKSSFLDAILNTLGPYGLRFDFRSLASSTHRAGQARSDVVRLRGRRMAASFEVENGQRLAEGLVKTLTGGDTIAARDLFKSEVEFKPAAKFWLAANARPVVSDDDDAMWRRIRVVPFVNVVPEEKRDPTVKARLTDPTIAGPAILAWALKGLTDLRANGLIIPAAIRKATQAYRSDMDPLADFWTDCCSFEPSAWTASSMLLAACKKWADDRREQMIPRKAFWNRLAARGCKSEKSNQARGWLGVKLVDGIRDDAETAVEFGEEVAPSRKTKEVRS
jgi:P4 family phage/plasmid primase-like protien